MSPKSGIALLLSPKGKEEEAGEEKDGADDGGDMDAHGEAACAEFEAAAKRGDHAAMWDAYKTMHKLCEGYEGDEGDEDEERKEEE